MKGNVGSLLIFILVFAVARIPGLLWPDFANFSPAYALAFCAGVYFAGRAAWWIPLGAMFTTDLGLNLFYWLRGYDIWGMPLLKYQLLNYAAFAVIIWLGRRFKPQSSFTALLGGGILGALLFYFITNTMSWLVNPFQNPEYTKSFLGWIIALTKGTGGWPETWQFFRNTLLSGGLFTAIFVGAMKLSEAAESPQDKVAGQKTDEPEGSEPAEETA